jgi:inosine-uridine nucleoside N-ribohydrolase
MLKKILGVAAVTLCLMFNVAGEAAKQPVILDADMVDWFDDGAAMLMLAKSPKIELMGVTTVIGNTWVETGVASAIRQLEGIKATNIPVLAGVNKTINEKRFKNIAQETKLFGRGKDSHQGAAGYPEPVSWQAEYRKSYGEEPTYGPSKEGAVDFIIRNVKARPHEVTIVAIGTGANLAAAVQKAPEIAPLVKRVIYMCGAFFQQGNVMPAAEFNVWLDPEAEKIAFRAPFSEQIIVPLDACEKIQITWEKYFELKKKVKSPILQKLIKTHWMTDSFEKHQNPPDNYVWDGLAAAIAIDPTIITKEVTMPVDVNDVFSPSYGQTLAYKGAGPEGTQKARIILNVDEKKLWQMIYTMADKL